MDDFIIKGNNDEEIERLTRRLHQEFSIKNLRELSNFLGIEVGKMNTSLHLSQKKDKTKLLTKVKTKKANPFPTPMVSNSHLYKYKGVPIKNAHEYRSIVGLQYAHITRPNITYKVNKVFQFMQNPLNTH